jgi:hypothetical protein
MAFDAKCTGDAKKRPVIFLVEKFLNTAGNLAEYPDETKKSFDENFKRNIDLLKANPNLPLFTIQRTPTLDQVRDFLGAGDIVLGFVHLPPYQLVKGEEVAVKDKETGEKIRKTLLTEIERRPSGALEKEKDSLVNRFFKKIESRLNAASDPQHPPKIKPPRITQPGEDVGIGIGVAIHGALQVKLKKGDEKKVFFSIRVGIIDVGFPASQSVEVWADPQIRDKILKILATPEKSGFGPQTVSLVKQKVNPNNKREIDGLNDYLKSVGRGLAYNLLHEFWHAAQRTEDHPFERGDAHIEGTPSPSKRNPLAFQNAAISEMLTDYENTWCKYIKEGRVGVGDLQVNHDQQ